MYPNHVLNGRAIIKRTLQLQRTHSPHALTHARISPALQQVWHKTIAQHSSPPTHRVAVAHAERPTACVACSRVGLATKMLLSLLCGGASFAGLLGIVQYPAPQNGGRFSPILPICSSDSFGVWILPIFSARSLGSGAAEMTTLGGLPTKSPVGIRRSAIIATLDRLQRCSQKARPSQGFKASSVAYAGFWVWHVWWQQKMASGAPRRSKNVFRTTNLPRALNVSTPKRLRMRCAPQSFSKTSGARSV